MFRHSDLNGDRFCGLSRRDFFNLTLFVPEDHTDLEKGRRLVGSGTVGLGIDELGSVWDSQCLRGGVRDGCSFF